MIYSKVIAEVMKDQVFYANSGGGMTISGGEPLFQPEFTAELLVAAKKAGLHCCLDTCGFAPWEKIEAVFKNVADPQPRCMRSSPGRPKKDASTRFPVNLLRRSPYDC